jgi:predicted transcriptional regulator
MGERLAARPLTLKGEKALRHTGGRQRDGVRGAVPLLAVLLVAIAVSTLLDAPSARAFPQTTTRDGYFASAGFGDMAVVDVNGDGHKDIVLSNRAAPDGNGTFTVWLYNPTLNGYGNVPDAVVKVPRHLRMIVDDLNNDNRLDVVILTEQPTTICSVGPLVWATVCVYIQPLTGFRFVRDATAMIRAPGAIDIAAGALRGTAAGKDIAVLYPDRATVYNAIGAPPYYPTSADKTITNSSGYTRIMADDVNDDAFDDLALANPNEVKILFGTPSGIVDCDEINCRAYPVPGSQTGNVSIVVADVLGDSRPDIAMVVSNSSKSTGTIVILERVDPPLAWNFTERFRRTATDFTDQLTFGDFNADGANDMAVVLYSRGDVAVYYRNPSGTFDGTFEFLLSGTNASGKNEKIGHGDFNDDGLEDIALRSPDSVSFFLQQDAEVQKWIPGACPDDCPRFNQGGSGDSLINLSDYFMDDHGPIIYSISQSSPDIVASRDGTYLDFTVVTQGWTGVMRFNVSANDLYPGHQAAVSQFEVMVNGVPVITSTPPAQVTLGGEYDYLPVIYDPSAVPGYSDSHTFTTLGVTPPGLSLDVNSGLVRWRPSVTGDFTITIQATDNYGAKSAPQTFTITVVQKPNEPPSGPLGIPLPNDTNGMIVLMAILGAILLISSILAVNENAKYGFLLMLLPLYSKIKREKVLDHFIRGQIFGYVMANPGEHYNAIKQALDITNGSLAHHLRTLEREHFVQSKRFGLYRRFYPWAMRVPEDGYFRMNEIQKSILALCRNQPGVSQKELAGSLNLTPPTINYHIAILAEHGHVSVIRRGRKTQIYVLKGAEDEAHRQVPH